MAQPLTPEEEEQLKELRRRKAKMLRDQKRVRKYSPRKLISKPEKRWEQAVRLAKEGKSYSQIAKEMDISEKSVWMHLTSHGYSLSQLKPKTTIAPKNQQYQKT